MRGISEICRDYLFIVSSIFIRPKTQCYDFKSSHELAKSSHSYLSWNRVTAELHNTDLYIRLVNNQTHIYWLLMSQQTVSVNVLADTLNHVMNNLN